jgi:hypothetical protein
LRALPVRKLTGATTVALAVTAILASTAIAGALTPWWSNPVRIDPHGGAAAGIGAVSCATASMCVATDSFGDVLSTTAPTAGVDGWRTTAVDSAGDADAVALGPVACSPGLCVTDDRGGNVIASSDPIGGAQEWTTASVPIALDRPAQLSCPTSHLCVVVDGDDEILSSTDPTAGAGVWSATRLGPGRVISAVSCPTSSFCVATDNSGSILTSTDPTGGAGAWTATPLPPGHYNLWAISCPTLALCAAVDHDSGDLLSSGNPTGGSGAWSLARIMPSNRSSLLDISCPVRTLCVATDDAGAVHTSSDPTAGSRAWTTTFIDGVADTPLAGIIRGVSCPTRVLCVAVDQRGNALTSTDPAGPVAVATRPAIPFASLAGVRNARLTLSLTVTAGIPPAGELAQLALTLPRGIAVSANGKKLRGGIILRRAGGTRVAVVVRASRSVLALRLKEPALAATLAVSSPAITLSRALALASERRRGSPLAFGVRVTDAQGITTKLRVSPSSR